MSQQYDYDYTQYPPPPPTSTQAGPAGQTHGVLRPAITTTFLAGQFHQPSAVSTPIYGAHLAPQPYSPRTPSALNPQLPSPGHHSPSPQPAMEPYNPRQWNNNRGQVSGSQMVFQQRHTNAPLNTTHVTGMEAAMPSPPPPYSPETPDNTARAAITSPMLESIGFSPSPVPVESSARNSPQINNMSPAFPPPPPQQPRRDRSASGQSGQRSFFSLAGLRGKQPVNVEPQIQPQAISGPYNPSYMDGRPPAARRAASTGHMQSGASASSSSAATSHAGRESPESRWQQGMPLPGPPPGPPPPGPAGNRSQSLNRPSGAPGPSSVNPERGFEAGRQRRTMAVSSLGPVPPTPADWVETDQNPQSGQEVLSVVPQSHTQPSGDVQPLRIGTGAHRDGSLTRRPATRDMSAQGIRERRSRSRATQGVTDGDSRPSNLIFSPDGGSISQRREHARTASGYLGPGPSSAPAVTQSNSKAPETVLTPPYTPAVSKKYAKVPGSASSDRPVSHLLHTPNEDNSMQAPLSPARPASSGSAKAPSKMDAFSLQAIERHRAFVEKEAAASSDEERLELFANFLVHESRLRRDRYTVAYNAMAGEIVDLTRDMWRPYATRSRRAITPSTSMSSFDPTAPSWGTDSQPTSAHGHMPGSASSMGDFTPNTDSGSMGEGGDSFERSEGRQWAESFKPSLSPIPSMAVSTVPDENDSRGRSASRWWEAGHSGAGSIGRPDRLEKSRRETKYMGINPAVLQASAQPNPEPSPDASSQEFKYGPDEYPPEKVGWHDGLDLDTPMQTPHRVGGHNPSTPGIEPLDVSRLVTLPPPYPRHHPAINNSHPRLNDLRNEHRFLADHSEIQKIKDAYLDQDFALTREQQEAEKKRRSKLRTDIQSKIADGSMSFAAAAQAEADFDVDEAERGKTDARARFDVFETSVSHPLNTLLTERLGRADKCIRQLRADLESGQESTNPNQAQEEGDEHPERLEKLTLLKWLFEAREQLHKEMFDLHAMRSEKYSEVILTPYRISKSQTKIDEATSFFKKDSLERQVTFAKDSLKRVEELQTVMEANVSRGVEDQLSAFWDIAPGLLEVIQQIPEGRELAWFKIHIPCQEIEENPSYRTHPMQYLLSLLGHAEKSAYQFIESQINLLCLLHEVRTATARGRLRVLEIETEEGEMGQARRAAEEALTRDLKEKVGEVEGQWEEALGRGLGECRKRVEGWLEESGGLEEGLDG